MPSPTLSFKAHATIGRTMFLFPPLLKVCFLPTEYRFCLLPYLQGLPRTVPDPDGFRYEEHEWVRRVPSPEIKKHDVTNSLKTIISGHLQGT